MRSRPLRARCKNVDLWQVCIKPHTPAPKKLPKAWAIIQAMRVMPFFKRVRTGIINRMNQPSRRGMGSRAEKKPPMVSQYSAYRSRSNDAPSPRYPSQTSGRLQYNSQVCTIFTSDTSSFINDQAIMTPYQHFPGCFDP